MTCYRKTVKKKMNQKRAKGKKLFQLAPLEKWTTYKSKKIETIKVAMYMNILIRYIDK